jgi:hypothetical protein
MDKSSHGKNLSEAGALTSWRTQTEGQLEVRTRNYPSERGALTDWRVQTEDKSGHGMNLSE